MSKRILYYDCFAGISGDMNLGALVDVGVPASRLRAELLKLEIEGYELRLNLKFLSFRHTFYAWPVGPQL